MRKRFLLGIPVITAVVAASGCITRTASYTPAYVPAARPAAQVPGRAVLLVESPDADYVYSGRPDSFHAGGTTLVMPLGRISTEIAQQVFGGVFSGGCVSVPQIDRTSDPAAIIKVRPLSYWYGFNQIRNLTMAITPQVRLSLEVSLMDSSRNSYFQQVYDSGVVSDTTTLDTLRPGETINKHTHRIVADLMGKAAADIARTVSARSAPHPAVTPPVAPAAAPGNATERLKRLKDLYEQGLISKEAYEAKQKEIIDSY